MRAGTRAVIAVVVICALLAGLWVLGVRAQPAPVYQGDRLGMVTGESARDYGARAEASLGACDGGGDGAVWALVSFYGEEDPRRAADILAPAPRVSAVVFGGAAARPVPEPVRGEGRDSVFEREADRLRAATGIEGARPTGAVVRADCADLQEIRSRRGVYAVEALPADARWSAFAISPVTP